MGSTTVSHLFSPLTQRGISFRNTKPRSLHAVVSRLCGTRVGDRPVGTSRAMATDGVGAKLPFRPVVRPLRVISPECLPAHYCGARAQRKPWVA